MIEFIFKINNSKLSDILGHLASCDGSFVPPLNNRVDIKAYSSKLLEKATRFEAWVGGELIGLIALYHNTSDNELFITNVSVKSSFSGLGIASTLLNKVFTYTYENQIKNIRLEVNSNNKKALNFYYKHNFQLLSQNADNLQLIKPT